MTIDKTIILPKSCGHVTLKGDHLEMSHGDVQDVSDGYHTFRELYEHRYRLFLALMQAYYPLACKSLKNHNGSQWEGWFIAWIRLPTGQISYHLPMRFWDECPGAIHETCYDYDGHTSADVLERLKRIS